MERMNKYYPDWILYQIDRRNDNAEQIARINGRPEVVHFTPEGIKLFTSLDALKDGLPPIYSHEYVYAVEAPNQQGEGK